MPETKLGMFSPACNLRTIMIKEHKLLLIIQFLTRIHQLKSDKCAEGNASGDDACLMAMVGSGK